MSGSRGSSGRLDGDIADRDTDERAQFGHPDEAGRELDETTKEILRADEEARMDRLMTPEVGTTTDPASGEPSRGQP